MMDECSPGKYRYSLGMYEKALPDEMPLDEKMLLAKESGFDHVEFCVDLLEERAARLNWPEAERERWRSTAVRMGVPFTTFSLSLLRKTPLGMLDPEKNREAFRVIDEGCRLAVALGSRVMLVNGYDVYDEPSTPETVARFYENLPAAVGICAYHGVILGIENAEMPFCSTIEDAVNYCRAVPSPYFRVYGDIGNSTNAFCGDADRTVEDLRKGRGYVTSLHLKDSLPNEYRFRDYGKGHVDFAKCIAAAKEIGVHLFTAEIFCDTGRDYIGYVSEVARFLRNYF